MEKVILLLGELGSGLVFWPWALSVAFELEKALFAHFIAYRQK